MTYQYVSPDEDTKKLMQLFRDKFEELHTDIQKSCKDGRGKSLCLTKLEESNMWLNKQLTNNC